VIASVRQLAKSDYLKLVPILALAFYIAFIPHQSYPYPVHLDEWNNLASAQALIKAGSVSFPDTWTGGEVPQYPGLEAGFYLFWAIFHQVSGIPWLTIFRYFPSVIFIMTILSVYILARREGFGWEAALLTCLLPTTVGVLGPAFMVPMAMGLLFIPLSLFLAFHFRNWWSYLLLSIFMFFLLAIHAATAVGLAIVLAPYIVLNLKGDFRHSMGITLALVIPFLGPLPWIFDMLRPTAESLLTPVFLKPFVDYPRLIQSYGYLPILFCLVGTLALVLRGGKKSYGLILGLLALLLMLATFYSLHYGVPIMYERGMTYTMLMMSIVAGAGLMAVKSLRLPAGLGARLKIPIVTGNIGNILCLALIGLTLAMVIPARQNTPYYHMINGEDYEAFVWIRQNVDSSYEKAVLDPWKATAFTAITGRHVYTRITAHPWPSDEEASKFLSQGCKDTAFMRNNGISIVYTRASCDNPDLVEVRKYVYLLIGDRVP
jgi:hypothetical protein